MRLSAIKFIQPAKALTTSGHERGFTLIETILSLSILVIMIGIVLSSMRLGQKAWQKGEGAIEDAGRRRFTVKRLGADVVSMYLYKERQNGHETYIFKGLSDELAFVTTNRGASAGLPWGGALYVTYFAGKDGLSLKEQTVPLARDKFGDAGKTINIDPTIKDARFTYLGAKGWRSRWDMRIIKKLPIAVRAEFTFVDGKDPLVITMPIGQGYDPAINDKGRQGRVFGAIVNDLNGV